MSYCSSCGNYLQEGVKFCSNCGASVSGSKELNSNRKIVYEGSVHKCPNCGEVISSFTANCPVCGYEFRGTDSSSSIQAFVKSLLYADSDKQKISIIRSFPIPNTKEDIFEYMLLASTSIKGEQDKAIFDAWIVKFEQSYQKAKLVIQDKDDFARIQNIFDETQKQVKLEKRRRGAKAAGRTLSRSGSVVSYVAPRIASLIGKNLAVVAGFVLYSMAIKTDSNGGNSSGLEFAGACLLITSASMLFRRSVSYFDLIIGALSGVLSIHMARYLNNGSLLMFSGWIVLIIVVCMFFKKTINSEGIKEI